MTARELIIMADRIRREQKLTSAEWSRAAGLDEVGMAVSRAYNRGNCKLTTLIRLLKPLGCSLVIVSDEETKQPEGITIDQFIRSLGYELKVMKLEDMP